MKDKRATGRTRACGRAGCPHATAGSAGKVLRHVTTATLFCFGNFMNKEGRSEMVGRGIAGEYCSPDTWRPTSWGGAMRAGGLGGGRESGNDEDKSGERKRALAAAWLGDGGARDGSAPPPSSFFSISFSRLVKNFTKRNFIFPFLPSPVFRFVAAPLPPLPRYNCYAPITFSFCL